ncbi:TetR/AcrR family transcriptional regulator [Hyphomicrobium methylovorum]|uniref:TetR/AcrR family transcriptional regulator n=1 Tax=Hyphomicrobium methylovorum TaxID=84 RepID=UPI0015E7153C|nr:TetR/AcrR family transcriptional regulator [Hyphomicrobium methylovorum]MBA2125533.1 TetR/AcrR family transcriptional regulator [Hyphomicrobium methylovorum]
MAQTETKSALLAEAEILIRTKGYAAFSYADLSDRIGIRKASIHHHFPTKELLGVVLVDTYLERFTAELDALATKRTDTKSKLLSYGDFFAVSLRDGLMPLCGALAADVAYLPTSMQKRVKTFFEIHADWLEAILRDGVARNDVRLSSSPRKCALLLLSTLQGACVVAWALKDPTIIKPAFRQAVENMTK